MPDIDQNELNNKLDTVTGRREKHAHRNIQEQMCLNSIVLQKQKDSIIKNANTNNEELYGIKSKYVTKSQLVRQKNKIMKSPQKQLP
jgi:hypothetical protein